MSGARFRAWHFLLPGFDAADAAAGLEVFAHRRDPDGERPGVDPPVDPAAALHASGRAGDAARIRLATCTAWSSRPTTPRPRAWRCHYVRAALLRWEPRIEIVRLDAEADTDDPAGLGSRWSTA